MIAVPSATGTDYASNLRRLMAREGLTLAELARRSKLNHRTLKGILAGDRQPQPRTLHQLADGLNAPVEELFQDPALLRHRLFDRYTNPVVDEVIATSPQLFHGWTSAEFDELYSRFGAGGALTKDGTLASVRSMNRRRELLAKVTLLLETTEADVLETMIEAFYRRAVIVSPNKPRVQISGGSAEDRDFVRDVAGAAVGNSQLI